MCPIPIAATLWHCFGVCSGLCSVGTGFCYKGFFRMKIRAVPPCIMGVELNGSAKIASERTKDTLTLTVNAVQTEWRV